MENQIKSFEIIKNGLSDDINILSEFELENILGGYKIIHCAEGYSLKKDTVTCDCGYSLEERDDDDDDKDGGDE